MATLVKKGGWYYLQFYSAHRQPNRKKVALRTRTAATARVLRRKWEDACATGDYDPWTDDGVGNDATESGKRAETFGDALDLFLESRVGCRPSTIQHYEWVLRHCVTHVGPGRRLGEVTPEHIARWLASTKTNQVSRKTYLDRVRIFARFLTRSGIVEKDLTAGLATGRVPDKLSSKLVTVGDLQTIEKAARERGVTYIADVARVTFYLALRLSEACALRWSWVDLSRGRLTIRQDARFQTKSGREVVKPIPDSALEVLVRLSEGQRENGEAAVFLNTKQLPLSPKHTSKMFKRCVRDSKLRESITFHGLRHGGLSAALTGGASIEAVRLFAGHSTTAMSMRYVHLTIDQYADSIKRALSV
jgi:integrase